MNSGKHSLRRPGGDTDLPNPVEPDQPDLPAPDEPEQPDMPGPDEPEQPPPPIKAKARAGGDARKNPDKQKENRQKLGVDEDHLTPDMKKHHRGTYP